MFFDARLVSVATLPFFSSCRAEFKEKKPHTLARFKGKSKLVTVLPD